MTERNEPLVAVVCAVPILGEALTAALDGLAECKVIPARQPELGGLLKSLQPDAIVVDDELFADGPDGGTMSAALFTCSVTGTITSGVAGSLLVTRTFAR